MSLKPCRDDVIEKAMQRLRSLGTTPDEQESIVRAFADAGLLVDELPPEPPPVGQARLAPTGTVFVKLSKGRGERGVWASFTLDPFNPTLTDDDVRDWPVLVPETDLDDVRAERDRIAARAAELEQSRLALLGRCHDHESRCVELEQAGAQAVDADALAAVIDADVDKWVSAKSDGRDHIDVIAAAIREHLPAASRPALPEGHVAVDVSHIPSTSLRRWIKTGVHAHGWFLGDVARAELARRGESA